MYICIYMIEIAEIEEHAGLYISIYLSIYRYIDTYISI